MLFGNSRGKLSSSQISFLNTVDTEYMKAFNTKSMREIQKYMTRECAVKVSREINSIGQRYFGAPKFRNTQWIVLECDAGVFTIIKEVIFDKVKVAGSLRIGVADNYKEQWVLDESGKKPVICDLVKIS